MIGDVPGRVYPSMPLWVERQFHGNHSTEHVVTVYSPTDNRFPHPYESTPRRAFRLITKLRVRTSRIASCLSLNSQANVRVTTKNLSVDNAKHWLVNNPSRERRSPQWFYTER
ncbi:hypothetical protein M413DRAFT_440634, partial [Hebeloma cylindrosporum]